MPGHARRALGSQPDKHRLKVAFSITPPSRIKLPRRTTTIRQFQMPPSSTPTSGRDRLSGSRTPNAPRRLRSKTKNRPSPKSSRPRMRSNRPLTAISPETPATAKRPENASFPPVREECRCQTPHVRAHVPHPSHWKHVDESDHANAHARVWSRRANARASEPPPGPPAARSRLRWRLTARRPAVR